MSGKRPSLVANNSKSLEHRGSVGLQAHDKARKKGALAPAVQNSVQEISTIQRVSLRRSEACIADNAPQLFFRGAVIHPGGADDVFFQHHGTDVIATKSQPHLADLQTLSDPAGLHVQEVRKEDSRNRQDFQVL